MSHTVENVLRFSRHQPGYHLLFPARESLVSDIPAALQRQNTEIWKQIFPEKEYRGLSPNFPHSCICERFIYSHDWSSYSAGGNM